MRKSYWYSDWCRCIFSAKFLLAVGGVFLVHILIMQRDANREVISVLDGFNRIWGSNGKALCYLFTTLAYGQCFAEDLEQGYAKYEIIRGSTGRYVISKCVFIAVSANAALVAGRLLFVLFLRIQYPWEIGVGEKEILNFNNGFVSLLEGEKYPAYFFLSGFSEGIWAAILALLAAITTFYTGNQLLVLAFPIVANHLIRRVLLVAAPGWDLDPSHLFSIVYNRFDQEWRSLGAAAIIGIIVFVLTSLIIYASMERRMTHG